MILIELNIIYKKGPVWCISICFESNIDRFLKTVSIMYVCQFVKTYYSFKIVGRRHARRRIQLELTHADNPLFTKSLKECMFFEVSY